MKPIPQAFVIGHPIAHSRSPMLHGYWLAHYDIEGAYDRRDVLPEKLGAFFAELRAQPYAGCNVTVPHKEAAIPFLDQIDATAKAMGAVNTVYWQGDQLIGTNTDAMGFMRNLDDRCPDWADGAAAQAVVIGAGGAARAAVYGLLERGFSVTLGNRTLDKAVALAHFFGGNVKAVDLAHLPDAMANADLLVNTTSAGMVHQPSLELDLLPLKASAVVCDIVYVPLETELLKEAKARGHRTVDGLGMLLHQAVIGFELWFGTKPDVTSELRALIEADVRAKTP
jgi:shikimate dehydrogenase